MVAAPPVPGLAPDERKAHSELIRIYAADASLDSSENDVVVFGRVIEGLDVVKDIANSPFNTQRETEDGRGVPRDLIEIVSVTVER
jgi:cyclophilin family peptidyl-prolyl cis-trans isomerase